MSRSRTWKLVLVVGGVLAGLREGWAGSCSPAARAGGPGSSEEVCPGEGRAGSIVLKVTTRGGEPYPGLGVEIDGTGRRATTSNEGLVRFDRVPAGTAALSFFDVFFVIDPHGQPVRGEMRLPAAALVKVAAGQVARLESQVEARAATLVPMACASTPWAIVGITTGGIVPFLAKGSVGRTGPCQCRGFADDPLGDPACPGTTVFGAGAPPPPQLWSVISETCLGEVPACAEPIEAVEASVFR